MVEILGRDAELDALRHFVDRIPEGPCALTLEGEAGIGKTTLWNTGVGYGRQRGFRLLICRSSESEAELSHAGLTDVLAGVPWEALGRLPDVQRHALEVALVRAEPGELPVDQHTVAAGTLGVLRWLASTGPVLIALDDPQWMDATSSRRLAYAIRRLEDEPVGVLAAVCVGEGLDDPLGLSQVFSEERRQRIELGPLSMGAFERLLARRLGWAPEGSALFELHTVSGGNPLFALEIARASMEDPERSLVVPRSLREQVSGRLAALPKRTRQALVVAAALPRPTLSVIDRVVSPGDEALEPAVQAGTIEIGGDAVRFTHPLYASVAYADAREEDRTRIHRRLAEVVSDAEERARHLALSSAPPDADVADALEEAARRARSRGAQTIAAELCLEARRFTPTDRAEDRLRRAVGAADDLYEAGDLRRAGALLGEALASSSAGPLRAQVLWRLGRLAIWRPGELGQGEAWLDQAEREAGADPSTLWAVHRNLYWIAEQRFRYREFRRHARAALAQAEHLRDPMAVGASLAMLAMADLVDGRPAAPDAVRSAIEAWPRAWLAPRTTSVGAEDHPGWLGGWVLVYTDRLEEARSVLEACRREAVDRGSDVALSQALYVLAYLEFRAGDWVLATRYAEDGCRVSFNEGLGLLARGMMAAHLGRVQAARHDLREVLRCTEEEGGTEPTVLVPAFLGLLELSLGNMGAAHRHLSEATATALEGGIREPGVTFFMPDAIEALVGVGDLGEAERLTDWLEERGRALDRVSALATGARCRGLLSAAKGDHEAALEHFERAMAEHERLPIPFERARTLLALGTIRRHTKQMRASREALAEALAIFDRLGAALWSGKARAELSSIGGRAPGTGGLTPTEQRVARLAAAGRTNREIADTLFLSVRTVEGHLSRAYHKLGVRSRTELALHLDPAEATT